MSKIFPKPVTDLPEADIPLNGVKGYLSQSIGHQIVFMEFSEDVEVPPRMCQYSNQQRTCGTHLFSVHLYRQASKACPDPVPEKEYINKIALRFI